MGYGGSLSGVDQIFTKPTTCGAEGRVKEKLTSKEVEHTGPSMYGDGGSPWLRFVAEELRSWLLRYQRQGNEMGFGPLPAPSHAPKRAKRQSSSASYSPMALIRWSSAGRNGRQQ